VLCDAAAVMYCFGAVPFCLYCLCVALSAAAAGMLLCVLNCDCAACVL